VRSSLTGTFGASLIGASYARSYPFNYTISAANTWEQKTVTIAGDTSGTWLTTNGVGLVVLFNLGSGSNYLGTANAWAAGELYAPTGSTSVIGTLNATWQVTGVQLEKGSTATSFDYRPYGTELALCQRYCFVYSYANTSSAYGSIIIGRANTTTLTNGPFTLPVPMRITPTLSWSGSFSDIDTGASGTSITANGARSTNIQMFLSATFSSGTVTVGNASYINANNSTTWYGIFSSEL
jgi:hypothetical protein